MTDERKEVARCNLCGEPMAEGEQMFKFHGYSRPCPKPPLPRPKKEDALAEKIADEVIREFPQVTTLFHLPDRFHSGVVKIASRLIRKDRALSSQSVRTPDSSLPPLNPDGPRRKMLVTIEVSDSFERRLDNKWEVEREIHADRWKWQWADTAPPTTEKGLPHA